MQEPIVGYGLCQCGCGKPTTISAETRARAGAIKGQPRRYLNGHRQGTGPVAFWQNVQRGDGCWEWIGQRDEDGYGRLGSQLAHRLMVDAPRGIAVLHTCDNPPCVNPAHLVLGSQADNCEDMARKGRGNRKLAIRDVHSIRALVAAGESHRSVAQRFGVSHTMVGLIIRRKARIYV
jgi:hypothetical protein